jgi:uncharacterized protein
MIQGYRMAGPPPHGEPPAAPPSRDERGWPPWLGFAALGVVIVASTVLAGVVFSISGADADETPAWLDLTTAAILQGSLLAGALGAAMLFGRVHPWQFGLRPTPFWRALGWSALGLVTFYIAAIAWVAVIGEPEQSTAEDIGAEESDLALYAAGFMFIFIAPVAEEIFFRGLFYGSLRTRLSTGPAAVICGVVFGVIHFGTGASAVPILIVLGIIFCLVREKTGSLYPCIAMHALNNTFAYAGQTDVQVGVALGLGAVMLTVVSLFPRVAWRRQPA